MTSPAQYNSPSYEAYSNFESYLLLLEKADWKKHVQLKDKNNYATPLNLGEYIDSSMISQH